jgi:hypothetical protein
MYFILYIDLQQVMHMTNPSDTLMAAGHLPVWVMLATMMAE